MTIYLRRAPLKELGIFIGPSTFLHPFKKSDLASLLLTANQRDGLSIVFCVHCPGPPSSMGSLPPPTNEILDVQYRLVLPTSVFVISSGGGFLLVNHFSMKTSTGHWKIWMKFHNEVCRLYREQLADVMSNFQKCLKFADKEDFWIVPWCFLQNIVKWNGILSQNVSC